MTLFFFYCHYNPLSSSLQINITLQYDTIFIKGAIPQGCFDNNYHYQAMGVHIQSDVATVRNKLRIVHCDCYYCYYCCYLKDNSFSYCIN